MINFLSVLVLCNLNFRKLPKTIVIRNSDLRQIEDDRVEDHWNNETPGRKLLPGWNLHWSIDLTTIFRCHCPHLTSFCGQELLGSRFSYSALPRDGGVVSTISWMSTFWLVHNILAHFHILKMSVGKFSDYLKIWHQERILEVVNAERKGTRNGCEKICVI